MKCPVCNAEASSGAAFCPSCGAKLPAAGALAGEAPQTVAQGRGRGPTDVPEETLWEGSYSPKAMIGSLVLCGLLSLGLVVVAVLFAPTGPLSVVVLAAIPVLWLAAGVQFARNRLGKSYRLTNQMFYHREGLLTRTTDRVELIEIHDVTWSQNLLERAVGVGTITITSADRTNPKLPLKGIEDVEGVAAQIDKARRAEQVRRGRRIDFSSVDHQT
jgi:membrane protein YdbS with pleckstrin-like domain